MLTSQLNSVPLVSSSRLACLLFDSESSLRCWILVSFAIEFLFYSFQRSLVSFAVGFYILTSLLDAAPLVSSTCLSRCCWNLDSHFAVGCCPTRVIFLLVSFVVGFMTLALPCVTPGADQSSSQGRQNSKRACLLSYSDDNMMMAESCHPPAFPAQPSSGHHWQYRISQPQPKSTRTPSWKVAGRWVHD